MQSQRRASVSPSLLTLGLAAVAGVLSARAAESIPLPEHPRPDFERTQWENLNGTWQFRFDPTDAGERDGWASGQAEFPDRITVPFPWGSKLSGLPDKGEIGWYRRTITVPGAWKGQRVFVVIGACDWLTRVWLDGKALGEHRGGYTPFEFELTPHILWGQPQSLVLRADDVKRPFKLEGKQGYGNARGVWQTVYLEARPELYLDAVHFSPKLDQSQVSVRVQLSAAAPDKASLQLVFKTGNVTTAAQPLSRGAREVQFEVPIPSLRPWSLDDPFLYEVEAVLKSGADIDRVATYFGMRKISVEKLPGLDHPWISLNGKPLYLQLTLDQSYHPEGFYTFPSDAFMRDEILRSKRIGLNGNRFHVKVDIPRKLYWADRLGLLVMADVPNSWGEPDAEMRQDIEHTLRGMLHRDFNHPAVFAWVPFNETWGLVTKRGDQRQYLPETQDWVASVYRLAKSLDPTRLVEDNSPCNNDHVATDINSWHAYLPGYAWRDHLDQVTRDTAPGSKWNFIGGRSQSGQPLLNSECGNVWGYEGSTGDVDWSWDYHIMMNEFRRHPEVCGWLYTEHHDVINEWNGYYRFDRTEKLTGLEELAAGMTLNDLHSPLYLSTGSDLCRNVKPGEVVEVPLFATFFTDRVPGRTLLLKTVLHGWDTLGRHEVYAQSSQALPFQPWLAKELRPLRVSLPSRRVLAVLVVSLENEVGRVFHRNFTTFLVAEGPAPRVESLKSGGSELRLVRFGPATFHDAAWSIKQWSVLDGLKVNGAGHGFFEYHVAWPRAVDARRVAAMTLVFEASAKRLFGKDRPGAARQEGDFMLGLGTLDPSLNNNSYPMTDTVRFPSRVRVRVNGVTAGVYELPDDAADHRGVLSWHAQLRDKTLREAGSYGTLINATIPEPSWRAASAAGQVIVRLEVDSSLPGGLALYGERFGRYPVDPTLLFHLK